MVIINESRCVGCAHCVPFCQMSAITALGFAKIDLDLCTNCKLCLNYCPKNAIAEG
ncbi:MAG: 4Fe-4S binding protein [Euryarchaeota archaeon]|nr:4Fe-4S binding protein [Euryarchaeota archaeon]